MFPIYHKQRLFYLRPTRYFVLKSLIRDRITPMKVQRSMFTRVQETTPVINPCIDCFGTEYIVKTNLKTLIIVQICKQLDSDVKRLPTPFIKNIKRVFFFLKTISKKYNKSVCNDICKLFIDLGGFDKLLMLQLHADERIYQISYRTIEQFLNTINCNDNKKENSNNLNCLVKRMMIRTPDLAGFLVSFGSWIQEPSMSEVIKRARFSITVVGEVDLYHEIIN